MLRTSPLWLAACLTVMLLGGSEAFGQFGYIRQVGGVWIDAEGVLRNIQPDETDKLRQASEQALAELPGNLQEPCAMRKISLARLESAIAERMKTGKDLSDEMRFLAGLQRVQYVFIYPDERDIVLAGPADGWKISPQGEVVGLTNNRPIMLLDDLLVVLRGIDSCREMGISCSIDPTAEGLVRLKELVAHLAKGGGSIDEAKGAVEEALGPQTITVGGISPESHFARVLVAADYRMKRMAMGFEAAPVKGMPSFLQMSKAGPHGMKNMLPRWWLEPDYEGLVADPAGKAWEIRGARVRTATEEDVLTASGARERTGKADAMAKKWADNMTRHYDELAVKDPIFGQLRNCIDLAVVAALISKEALVSRSGASLPLLMGQGELATDQFPAPKQVSTQVSLLKKGSNWLMSASGGVMLNPFGMLEEKTGDLVSHHDQARPTIAKHWWWN